MAESFVWSDGGLEASEQRSQRREAERVVERGENSQNILRSCHHNGRLRSSSDACRLSVPGVLPSRSRIEPLILSVHSGSLTNLTPTLPSWQSRKCPQLSPCPRRGRSLMISRWWCGVAMMWSLEIVRPCLFPEGGVAPLHRDWAFVRPASVALLTADSPHVKLAEEMKTMNSDWDVRCKEKAWLRAAIASCSECCRQKS